MAGANKTERAYGQRLDLCVKAGTVKAWAFESMRLRLADGTFYTPDFTVINADDEIEIHETKGFMREAARVRVKVASELHPFRFVLVKLVQGAWHLTPVEDLR